MLEPVPAAGPEWSLRIRISNKSPGDVGAEAPSDSLQSAQRTEERDSGPPPPPLLPLPSQTPS